MSEQTIHTIENLSARIRAIVEKETLDNPLWVGGVVSRVYTSDIGHIYFNLSDDAYSIRCMLRERRHNSIGFTPQNNMELEIFGRVRVYEQKATIEIEVEEMQVVKGQLMTNYTPIEEQLAKKGLWPPKKRALPQEVKHIGLVTSKNSEALHDFETNYRKEEGKAAVELVDVRIEGQSAVQEIADAIKRLNRENKVDVIVLTRGGGRKSDMSIFNDVIIAEAICRSEIVVITAIGHERNHFFADEVADLSVSTPTAAATALAKLHKPHEPFKPYKPQEPYEPYKPHEPYKPQEPYKQQEPHEPFKPYKPQEPYEPYKPQKANQDWVIIAAVAAIAIVFIVILYLVTM